MAVEYPHLAPELQTLSGDSRLLWGAAAARRLAVEAILAAPDEGALAVATARVDRAVVEGLQCLGLPRGPVRSVRVEPIGRGWLGRKSPARDIHFDSTVLSTLNPDERGDVLFQAWVPESLHARQRYSVTDEVRQRAWRGI